MFRRAVLLHLNPGISERFVLKFRTESGASEEDTVVLVLKSRTNFARNFVWVSGATVRDLNAVTMRLNPGKQRSVIPAFECSVTADAAACTGSFAKKQPIKALLSPEIAGNLWKQNITIADQYNKPSRFTVFVSYEWTSIPTSTATSSSGTQSMCR
jgi:Protein of unknown function (DUF3604)